MSTTNGIEFYGGYQVYSESGVDLTMLRETCRPVEDAGKPTDSPQHSRRRSARQGAPNPSLGQTIRWRDRCSMRPH